MGDPSGGGAAEAAGEEPQHTDDDIDQGVTWTAKDIADVYAEFIVSEPDVALESIAQATNMAVSMRVRILTEAIQLDNAPIEGIKRTIKRIEKQRTAMYEDFYDVKPVVETTLNMMQHRTKTFNDDRLLLLVLLRAQAAARSYDVEMARPHLYIRPTKLPYAVLTDKNRKVRHLRVGPTTILLWM